MIILMDVFTDINVHLQHVFHSILILLPYKKNI